jgi:hypothetical protein
MESFQANVQVNLVSPAVLGSGAVFFADAYGFSIERNFCVHFGRQTERGLELMVAVELLNETRMVIKTLKDIFELRRDALSKLTPSVSAALPIQIPSGASSQRLVANFMSSCFPTGEPEFTFGYYTMRFLNEAGAMKQGAIAVHVPASVTVRTTQEVEIGFLEKLISHFS